MAFTELISALRVRGDVQKLRPHSRGSDWVSPGRSPVDGYPRSLRGLLRTSDPQATRVAAINAGASSRQSPLGHPRSNPPRGVRFSAGRAHTQGQFTAASQRAPRFTIR